MASPINRRDFLKLAGLAPLAYAAPRLLSRLGAQSAAANVIVFVFDALSARHLSLHGYQRETMPNLTRLANRAIVYHNHYAGSNFTTSGTASLLTGSLPWTHRALEPGGGVAPWAVRNNIFNAFPGHYRLAYTHNGWANTLLEQFSEDLDELIPWKSLFLGSADRFVQQLFAGDTDIASVAWTRNMNIKEEGYAYSLFLSHVSAALRARSHKELRRLYPRGIPATGDIGSEFLLETAVGWIGTRLQQVPQPFLGYFHFLPPHGPYNTSLEYYGAFAADGLHPVEKPEDLFTIRVPHSALVKRRSEYDEFLLYADQNFARAFEMLESSGVLGNTWVVFTSDHGEMFERGISGHSTNTLYEPVVRIPLLIFEPGRERGENIFAPTSAIDVLPTLLSLTGQGIPAWTSGSLLPPYGSVDEQRSIFAARATQNAQDAPLSRASVLLVKGDYKLVYYFGYAERGVDELVRLYDVQSDPEELQDLAGAQPEIAARMLEELKSKLREVDQPFQ